MPNKIGEFETNTIAEVFNCGTTQIQTILRNQHSITRDYDRNAPAARKRPQHKDVDSTLNEWNSLVRQTNAARGSINHGKQFRNPRF